MTTIRCTATRSQYLAARASQKVRACSKTPASRHDAARRALAPNIGATLAPIPAAWREEADAADARRAARAAARVPDPRHYRREMGPEAIRSRLRAQRVLAVDSAWVRADYLTRATRIELEGEQTTRTDAWRPWVRVAHSTTWQEYGRQRYPRDHYTAVVSVPADWCWTVERSGLAVVDGLMTLWAREDTETERRIADPTLYEAVWVEQARGHAYRVVTGWIATGAAYWDGASPRTVQAHGATREEALATWHRRCSLPRHRDNADTAGRLQRRVLRLRRYWGVEVTPEDSRAAGNCAAGTRDWAAKHAAGAAAATVKDVLLAALTSGDRVLLAVAACEAAAKRARAAGEAA